MNIPKGWRNFDVTVQSFLFEIIMRVWPGENELKCRPAHDAYVVGDRDQKDTQAHTNLKCPTLHETLLSLEGRACIYNYSINSINMQVYVHGDAGYVEIRTLTC